MIRKLSEADRAAAIALLGQSPQMNLYMLGNLEKLGFDNPVCEFFGDVADAGTLRAVVNRYMTGWALWGKMDADWPGLAKVLETHAVTAERLQDNPGGVESILPFLRRYRAAKESIEEVMCLLPQNFRPVPPPHAVTVRRATQGDLDALSALYADAGHMRRTPAQVERPLRDARVWIAERVGRILSVALTNAETSQLAMVGGVYTAPDARGQGLSSAVCSALCQDLLADGKQPVLYWETPAAGAVYRKLGFLPVGNWRAIRLEAIAQNS